MTRAPYKWGSDQKLAVIKRHSLAKQRGAAHVSPGVLPDSGHPRSRRTAVDTCGDGFVEAGCITTRLLAAVVLGSPLCPRGGERRPGIDPPRPSKSPSVECGLLLVLISTRAGIGIVEQTLRSEGQLETRIGRTSGSSKGGLRRWPSRFDPRYAVKIPAMGRSLFFLDQYGYKEVPTPQFETIFAELPAAKSSSHSMSMRSLVRQ